MQHRQHMLNNQLSSLSTDWYEATYADDETLCCCNCTNNTNFVWRFTIGLNWCQGGLTTQLMAGGSSCLWLNHLTQMLFLRVTNKALIIISLVSSKNSFSPFFMLISLSNTPRAPLARLWGVTWYGRRCPHPPVSTPVTPATVCSHSHQHYQGGSFMTRSPHGGKQLPNLFGEQSETLMSPPLAPWESCTYEVPRQGEVTGRLCKIRLNVDMVVVVGGLQAEKKMNMHVHIYPENDYLLEHSLIVFHNSFCAYSPIFLLNLNKPINRD